MNPATRLSLTREQLYEFVWSKPMQHLAEDYSVTDRALAKLCRLLPNEFSELELHSAAPIIRTTF